jgi:hypothetical protein
LFIIVTILTQLMSEREYTTIPVKQETRDLVQSLKRGGISYDTLVREMAADYSPEHSDGDR